MNPRTLSTAEDRREAVLEAAVDVFADRGFSGTPTTEVATAAGISHAYLFRLFPTKSDLVAAVVTRCHERIERGFAEAAARAKAAGEDPLHAMGKAYEALVADRQLVLLQLHSHAAAVGDPAVRDAARAGFARLVELVRAESGADDERISAFFATGMLINVIVALDVSALDEPWARTLMAGDKDASG